MELSRILNAPPRPSNKSIATEPSPTETPPRLDPPSDHTTSECRNPTATLTTDGPCVRTNIQSDSGLENSAPASKNRTKESPGGRLSASTAGTGLASRRSSRSLPVAGRAYAQSYGMDEQRACAAIEHQPLLQAEPPWTIPQKRFSDKFCIHMKGKPFLEIIQTVWQICSHARQAACSKTTRTSPPAAFQEVEEDYKLILALENSRPRPFRDSGRCLFTEVMHQHTSGHGRAEMKAHSSRIAARLAALVGRFGVGCLACFAFQRRDLSNIHNNELEPFLNHIEYCCPTLREEIAHLSLLLPSLLLIKPPRKPLWIECIPFEELERYRHHSLEELLGLPPEPIPQAMEFHLK